MLLFLLACTEYGFSTPTERLKAPRGESAEPRPDEADTAPTDTGAPPADTGGPPVDEDEPPAEEDEPPPEETEDPCYEPEDGYDLNPAARVIVTDDTELVTVTFLYSDTAYQDVLWIDSPYASQLFEAWTASTGTSWRLGPFSVGTELVFAAYVTNTGDRWLTGPASRNSDGVVHGATTYEGGCSWEVGFEDLYGGGDLDFNDVIFRVEGPLRQED